MVWLLSTKGSIIGGDKPPNIIIIERAVFLRNFGHYSKLWKEKPTIDENASMFAMRMKLVPRGQRAI